MKSRRGIRKSMRAAACVLALLAPLLHAQTSKRLWVLKEPDQIAEYDAVTFAPKRAVKVPPAALKAPRGLQVNRKGEMLFTPIPNEPSQPEPKFWFWNGQSAIMLDRDLERRSSLKGPNVSVMETVPFPFLSLNGEYLFWFAIQSRKLQRENLDLSTTTTFRAWTTDLDGGHREELAQFAFPECRCETGTCSETC